MSAYALKELEELIKQYAPKEINTVVILSDKVIDVSWGNNNG